MSGGLRLSSVAIPAHILKRMSAQDRAPLGKAGRTAEEAEAVYTYKSEKKFQERCVQLLGHKGISVNRSRMDKKKTDVVGWPDLTFAVKPQGRALAIACAVECKMPGKDLEPEQAKCIAKLRAQGWLCATIWHEGELLAFLRSVEVLAAAEASK